MSENSWYLRTQDETFGPETRERLVEWARVGRILPGQEVSDDNLIWRRVEEVPFLDMRFSIDIGDGNPRGPFNKAAAEALLASGRLPTAAKMIEVRESFPKEEPAADPSAVETPAAGEVVAETPVADAPVVGATVAEEPVVEVAEPVEGPAAGETASVQQQEPVEKVVEKIVEKVVVDETRVKELEGLLEEARRRATELQVRLDAAVKDVELQREEFQQKAGAAAQEAAAALESARQKAELAAQDADARLLTARNESAALLAESAKRLEAAQKESAAQLEESRQRLEAAQRESAAQLDEARQKLEAAQRESAAQLDEARQKAEAAAKESAAQLAEAQQKAEAAQRDADAREQKLREQIVALENELRRLPQAASEVADLQAAVYSIMTKEAAELAELLDVEKSEADEFRRRQQERADRLLERRRELLKRTGSNIEDMTRKALVERPEDPRTAQLRREYEEFRRTDEKKCREYEDRLAAKTREVEELRREISRRNVSGKDAAQLQGEVVSLTERLQRCEKDLLSERQLNDDLRQRQAANQQVLMARLATLETPSIAPATAPAETRQSREAKAVRLPRWMTLGGKR